MSVTFHFIFVDDMKRQLQVYNYSIKNSSNGDHLDVYIDGDIVDAETQELFSKWWGDETSVSFRSLRNQVNDSGAKSITFWVNSYGGHVGDAMAIHDWIQEMDKDPSFTIKTKGIGMVCSAATYIVSAAKDSNITKNSWYMIHPVSGGVWGDINTMENYVRTMRKFNDNIIDFYVNLTGKTQEQITNWMNAETWFSGLEAEQYGFVAKCTGSDEVFTNKIDPQLFPYQNRNALTAYNSFVGQPKPSQNQEEIIIINESNMNKFIEAIVNAFKASNLLPTPIPENKEGEKGPTGEAPEATQTAELTEESLTNALTEGLKGFDFSNMIDDRLGEMFKDGLPENLQKAMGEIINTSIDTKSKENNPLESEVFTNLQKEVEEIKKDIENNAGGAKPLDDGKGPKNEFEHDGIKYQ